MSDPHASLPVILLSLTAEESASFFPPALMAQLEQIGQLQHVDPSAVSPEAWRRILMEASPEVLVACWRTRHLPENLPPSLRYVCYAAGSVKKLITRSHLEAGLVVSNWGGSISRTVAEAALMHILVCLRGQTHHAIDMHRDGGWRPSAVRRESLFERSVGLRGFGQVARALIALLRPFDCRIGVLAPDLTESEASTEGIAKVPDLGSLMANHDIVVELAPLTAETKNSIRREHLQRLQPGAVFINMGRGATVDHDALVEVAQKGEVSIGLDVFAVEPLPPDSELRGLSNVSMSPHVGGPTPDRCVDAGRFALVNLATYFAGEPLPGMVSLEAFDHTT